MSPCDLHSSSTSHPIRLLSRATFWFKIHSEQLDTWLQIQHQLGWSDPSRRRTCSHSDYYKAAREACKWYQTHTINLHVDVLSPMSALTGFPVLTPISVVEFRPAVCILFNLHVVHSCVEEVRVQSSSIVWSIRNLRVLLFLVLLLIGDVAVKKVPVFHFGLWISRSTLLCCCRNQPLFTFVSLDDWLTVATMTLSFMCRL